MGSRHISRSLLPSTPSQARARLNQRAHGSLFPCAPSVEPCSGGETWCWEPLGGVTGRGRWGPGGCGIVTHPVWDEMRSMCFVAETETSTWRVSPFRVRKTNSLPHRAGSAGGNRTMRVVFTATVHTTPLVLHTSMSPTRHVASIPRHMGPSGVAVAGGRRRRRHHNGGAP